MHLSTLIFFITLVRPFDWHWSIKLAIAVGGSMPILLVTYHLFVRFTWIGAMLNGRRQPRPEKSPPPDAAPAPGEEPAEPAGAKGNRTNPLTLSRGYA